MDICTNENFLAAALSALSKQSIVSQLVTDAPTFDMDSLHKYTLQWIGESQPTALAPEDFRINVRTLIGTNVEFVVKPADTVKDLKEKIRQVQRTPPDQQRLIFAGKKLEDGKALMKCGIEPHCTIHLMIFRNQGRGVGHRFDPKLVDQCYSYDFTHKTADGKVFNRGGRTYMRPYGWKRIAISVKGKYENDTWLGGGSYRTTSYDGEWPVSYHGTTEGAAEKIGAGGYDLKKGRGACSTPDPAEAERYAKVMDFEGKKYKVMLQNRVNMDDTQVVDLSSKKEYFVTARDYNIRPYGMLVKEECGMLVKEECGMLVKEECGMLVKEE